MYLSLFAALLVCALIPVFWGVYRGKVTRWNIAAAALLVVVALGFFRFMSFWGDMLWFESLSYSHRFWKVFLVKVGVTLGAAAFSWVVVHLLTWTISRSKRYVRLIAEAVAVFFGGNWGLLNWETILMYLNRVSTDQRDPILQEDTGFYLFTLPFYDALYGLLVLLCIVSLIAVVVSIFFRLNLEDGQIEFEELRRGASPLTSGFGSLYLSGAALVFVLAWGKYLDRYHLMYSTWGAVTGPGWTDVHIRLPAYTIVIVLTGLLGLLLAAKPLRSRFRQKLERMKIAPEQSHIYALAVVGIAIVVVWFTGLSLIPKAFQWLRVEPNEITYERPYIAHNIKFTRQGFGLHRVEEREFPASETFTQDMVEDNRNLFSNIRLWDWRALDAVYKQFQEIRLYYEFVDVDIDRYDIGDAYRQVMISAREMELENLPEQSQTFVNRRFKYTHGYGLTLTNVSEFTPEGLPNLLIKDIPPKSKHPDLKVEQPRIYYGELTRSHVIVNTTEPEFDYPSGEQNVYTRYSGQGGVVLSNLWRKFIFGWMFDGTKLFLSGYPTEESRILFKRQVLERVQSLAPFLYYDDDPYITLVDGKQYWIVDGYTTSKHYPYSEPFLSKEMIRYKQGRQDRLLATDVSAHLDSINYIRNSVKIVVDAYEGSVDFYIFEPGDPIIRVWDKIFPNLFKDKKEMPEGLQDHVRYPSDMLLIQGLVYAKYHMTDPTVFYNQEDLWIRATEKYYNQVQPVEPYYIIWEPPGSDEPEFVLMLPFTPKNRQVLIGWIAGMCDGENYGRFLAYKFPKEKRVLGTQQVETKIDQDRFLSGQLTLWDQRGSNVIRGNVLAIPIEDTLLYVEPIYLQAETAAYPELRLVVVMHNDRLSYAETFDKALEGLFEKQAREMPPIAAPPGEAAASFDALIQRANQAFESYLKALGQKRFGESSAALERLQKALRQLSEKSPDTEASPE